MKKPRNINSRQKEKDGTTKVKFLKIVCPCGHKSNYNHDKIVACPIKIFKKHATVIDIKGFKDEPIKKDLYCIHRCYGGPTCININEYTRKEYLILTDVYWYCGASSKKKKVALI